MQLVSINIPTFNSGKTLEKTLESVKNQNYKNVEVIVIDSYSKDNTVEIAKQYGAKVYYYKGALLGARYLGVKKSKGKYVLLLDSDQILEKTAVARAVKLMKNYDMLWLEERSYKPKNFLEKIYDADRQLVQKHYKDFLNPLGGVILPRFFKRELLLKAMNNIPKDIMKICVAHDHAIIYYECYKLSKRIGKLSNAVYHIEPSSILKLFKKTVRYGKTTKMLVEKNVYPELLKSKVRFRKFYKEDLSLSIKSMILRAIRAVPYMLGYYLA